MDVTKMIVEGWVKGYENPDYYQWMIVPKELNQPIGSIGVVSKNDRVEKAEIGYCIGQDWWHKGFMTESLQAVMDYLFDEIGMNRVEAHHDVNNPHSGGVMKKCGMKYEGILRQAARNNQGIFPKVNYIYNKKSFSLQLFL